MGKNLLEIGSKFGDYTVVQMLGRGAMGEVYRITNGVADYAVKIMAADAGGSESARHEWRRRFAREAEVAMKVHHRNLVEVYDVGEDPQTHLCYILMEYVGGGTLSGLLKRRGRLEIREAVAITIHIAGALAAAHRHGVVHRDIKPDNIMFAADGTPKLADLGIARVSDGEAETTLTKTNMIVGTPAYMSPEQMLNSHGVDARADIYSMGVVLYEMLTGSRPNQGSTVMELLARAMKGEELPDVRKLRPEVSVALSYALSRMVANKAEKRPASAEEAAKLVYDAANGKIVAKSPLALRWRAALWPAACCAALAVAVFSFFHSRQGYDAPPRVVEMVVTNTVEVVEHRVVTNFVQAVKPVQRTFSVDGGEAAPRFTVENGVLTAAELNGCTEIEIPDGVTGISRIPALRTTKFKRVKIPPSVKRMSGAFGDWYVKELWISDLAAWCGISTTTSTGWPLKGANLFLNGEMVRDMVVPGTVPIVKSNVFMDCRSLESVVFSEGVREIGTYAFYGCHDLKRVSIPSTLTQVGAFAFSYCTKLSSISVAPGNPVLKMVNGMLYDTRNGLVVTCPASSKSVMFPAGAKVVEASAFCGNDNIVTLSLPEGMTYIGRFAFCGCGNLRTVSIPQSVEEIGESAFANCKNLKTVYIPAKWKDSLPPKIFDRCPDDLKVYYVGID